MNSKHDEEFERAFEAGEDISRFVVEGSTRRFNKTGRKLVNVDFSLFVLSKLDRDADLLGVTRQSLIKTLIGTHYGIGAGIGAALSGALNVAKLAAEVLEVASKLEQHGQKEMGDKLRSAVNNATGDASGA